MNTWITLYGQDALIVANAANRASAVEVRVDATHWRHAEGTSARVALAKDPNSVRLHADARLLAESVLRRDFNESRDRYMLKFDLEELARGGRLNELQSSVLLTIAGAIA